MKPYLSRTDSGSVIIEWVSDEARFGINVEKDLKESGWFYVSKSGVADCGELPDELRDALSSLIKPQTADE